MSRSRSGNPNTQKKWDYLLRTKKDDLFGSSIYQHKNNIVVKLLDDIRGKVLDIGVGYGYIEEIVKKKLLPLEFFGIDISKYSVDQMRRKYGDRYRLGVATNIPFKKNTFDCILLLDVIEHITKDDASKVYSEVRRVLKPNGYLILSVPINEPKKDTVANYHLRKYTENTIEEEIVNNGFKIIRMKELYAFKTHYWLKSQITNFFPGILNKKPNLAIIKARV